jgi:hypothetical protein
MKSFDFIHHDSIWLAGTHNDHYGSGIPSWISVYQLDSNLNPRSVNYYGGDKYYCSFNVLATSDGGCLLTAIYDEYEGEQQWDVFILKLNRIDIITSAEFLPVNNENSGVSIFPNPGREKISVCTLKTGTSLSLFKLNGKQVLKVNLKKGPNTIDCSFLPPGTYIYSINRNNTVKNTGKWIKM